MTIVWTQDDVKKNLVEMPSKLLGAIFAGLTYEADNVQSYARKNAPWTDRTGNARSGLEAKAYGFTRAAGERNERGQYKKAGTVLGIVLYHQVPYGIWLEVAHGKKYAIVMPTINLMGPEVMKTVNGIMRKLS